MPNQRKSFKSAIAKLDPFIEVYGKDVAPPGARLSEAAYTTPTDEGSELTIGRRETHKPTFGYVEEYFIREEDSSGGIEITFSERTRPENAYPEQELLRLALSEVRQVEAQDAVVTPDLPDFGTFAEPRVPFDDELFV